MNTHQQNMASLEQDPINEGLSSPAAARELYRAPQLKIHGKLERLTLGSGTSLNGATDPTATPIVETDP